MKLTRHTQRSAPQTPHSRLPQLFQRVTDIGALAITVGLLALTVIAVVVALGSLGGRLSASPGQKANGVGPSTPQPIVTKTVKYSCGTATTPACQPPASDWIALSADTPAAVLQAAQKSALFNENRSGNGDYASDLTRLETPVLVHLLKHGNSYVPPAADFDQYAIPIDDASGSIVAVMTCNINTAHTAIEVTMIAGVDPRPHGQLAHTTEAQAVNEAQAQHGVTVQAGRQPRLIFLVVDASLIETGQITWHGGGLSAVDPLWAIPGSDGQDYVVGNDGKVYHLAELPVFPAPAAS